MAEVDLEINKPKQHHNKIHNELEDMKVASETASLRCRIDSNFSGRISWSTLDLESLLEPQEVTKENNINIENGKLKHLDNKFSNKDTLIDIINMDSNKLKPTKGQTEKQLVESEKMVEQLKAEVQRQKDSEKRLYDLFTTQTLQLEQAHIFIDKWKHRMGFVDDRPGITSYEENSWLRLQVERLENELGILRNGQNPWDEVMRLRKELEQAIEAEDKSKRAMDDLAVVIKEVAVEANQAKERLATTKQQLGIMKEETKNLKSMITIKEKAHHLALTEAKSIEEKHQAALGEAKRENESLKATIDRLKIEFKGSQPEKEIGFVDFINKEEQEKANMQQEKNKLLDSLNEAKDESRTLRDILKKAKVEIAQLKESQVEKEKEFIALAQETEYLKKNEAPIDKENIKESKKQIRSQSRKDPKVEEKEQRKGRKENCCEKDTKGGGRSSGELIGRWRSTGDLKSYGKSIGSFGSLNALLLSSKNKELEKEEHETDERLTDSIFDIVHPVATKSHHTRSVSAITFTDDESSITSEEFDSLERPQVDDLDTERGSNTKKKVLLKKFSELWRKKGHHRSNSLVSHS